MGTRPRILLLAALTGIAACRSTPAGSPTVAPPSVAGSFEPIPNAPLVDQDGRVVHFYDDLVRDRVVVIQFFFVHCEGICPLSTGKMLAMRDALGERMGREVDFVSITLDPEQDTPEVLAEYARDLGAGPGWTFLTGAKADIEALRWRLGVFDLDPVLDADRTQHAGVLVLGSDAKQRWSMKPATLSASVLTRAVLRLAEEPG